MRLREYFYFVALIIILLIMGVVPDFTDIIDFGTPILEFVTAIILLYWMLKRGMKVE